MLETSLPPSSLNSSFVGLLRSPAVTAMTWPPSLRGFEVVGQRGDFDFAILGDEELQVRLDGSDDAAAIWAGGFLS